MPGKQTKYRVEVGRRLRTLRERLGLQQDEIGKILGMVPNAVSMIESGIRGLDPEKARHLKSDRGVTLDWLYAGDPSTLPHGLHKLLTTPVEIEPTAAKDRRKAL